MDVDRTSWASTLVKNHGENKTYILVRLSESLTSAIQEYSSPTIEFHGTRGAIRFSNGKSYDFSLEQSDNSVECIKQTKSRWESVGKMACCLHVKGKDDVYQRTRTKMEAAEQQKRKYCTKLLGSPDHNTNSSTKRTKRPPVNNISINNKTTTASNKDTSTRINNSHYDVLKYPEIVDEKQSKRYKAEFDKDFKEYQNLHGYLQRIEERFRKLKESLKQSVEGSPEWESAKEQIFEEYDRLKSDNNFHRARSKYKQLRSKLAHIKEKILQFKNQKKERNKKRKIES